MSGHCEGVCTPAPMVCALVYGFTREVRRGWQDQKPLIFMHFHGVFLGSQHEIWSKQHNGKVSTLQFWRRNKRQTLRIAAFRTQDEEKRSHGRDTWYVTFYSTRGGGENVRAAGSAHTRSIGRVGTPTCR